MSCLYMLQAMSSAGLSLLDVFEACRAPAVQAVRKKGAEKTCAIWHELCTKSTPDTCICMASPSPSDMRMLTNHLRARDLQESRFQDARRKGQVDRWRAGLAGQAFAMSFKHTLACTALSNQQDAQTPAVSDAEACSAAVQQPCLDAHVDTSALQQPQLCTPRVTLRVSNASVAVASSQSRSSGRLPSATFWRDAQAAEDCFYDTLDTQSELRSRLAEALAEATAQKVALEVLTSEVSEIEHMHTHTLAGTAQTSVVNALSDLRASYHILEQKLKTSHAREGTMRSRLQQENATNLLRRAEI